MIKKLNSKSHFLKAGMDKNRWWELYQLAQEKNDKLVKILSFDKDAMTITMEDVSGFNLDNISEIKKLSIEERRNITAQIIELYASLWRFHVSDDDIFMHRDFLLVNIMYTKEKKLKLVDPDSFMLFSPKGPNGFGWYGNIFDVLITCKEWEQL